MNIMLVTFHYAIIMINTLQIIIGVKLYINHARILLLNVYILVTLVHGVPHIYFTWR